ALPVLRERAERSVGDQPQRVEAPVDVLADRVVPAGDYQIELARAQQRDRQRDGAETGGAGGAGGGGEAVEIQPAARPGERVRGEEVLQRLVAARPQVLAAGPHAVQRRAQQDAAAVRRVRKRLGGAGVAQGGADGPGEVADLARVGRTV